MHSKSNRGSRCNPQVHERCVSPAMAKHIKGHEKKRANHVNIRVLEHTGKCALLRLTKVRCSELLCIQWRLALRADSYHKINRGTLAWINSLSPIGSDFHKKILYLCWSKDI